MPAMVPDSLQCIRQMVGKRAGLKVYMHALPDFLPALPGTAAFMVALRSCQQVGCKGISLQAGSMALQIQIPFQTLGYDAAHSFIPPAYIHIIHDFRDSQHLRQFQKAGNFLLTEYGPAVLRSRHRGYTGGSQRKLAQGCFLCIVQHEAYPFNPQHICNLMRIHDNGSGPPGKHGPSEILRNHHSTFHMKMGVNKPRYQVTSSPVKNPFRRQGRTFIVCTHPHNDAVQYIYLSRVNLPGKHVDQLYIADSQVTGDFSHSCPDHFSTVHPHCYFHTISSSSETD